MCSLHAVAVSLEFENPLVLEKDCDRVAQVAQLERWFSDPVNRWPSFLRIRMIPSAQVLYLRQRDGKQRSMLTNPPDACLYRVFQANSCGCLHVEQGDTYGHPGTFSRRLSPTSGSFSILARAPLPHPSHDPLYF